jgi:hypothetical protein
MQQPQDKQEMPPSQDTDKVDFDLNGNFVAS